jgi:hypothetical protein
VPIKFELKPIRSVYGTPWSRLAGGVTLDRKTLNLVGQTLVKEIVKEAKLDLAKQGNKRTPVGEPEGIPNDPKFFQSFTFQIRGKRTIEILSTWPWIEQIIEGRDEYKMTWLTQQAGVNRVPMRQENGTVLVRTTPSKKADAWIHPGFARHRFLERGIQKGRDKAAKYMLEDVARQLANGDPTK